MPLKRLLKGLEIPEEPHRRDDEEKEPPPHDESNWLVSYADMMTLLCVFFVLMFTMAKLDEPQYEKVKESVAKKFGGDYKSPTEELTRFVSQVIQEKGIEKETSVKSDPGGVTVTFQSTLFFDTLSADVRPEGSQILDKLIKSIMERQDAELKKYKIVVEGHTDSRPVLSGPYASNWELSGSRASRVIRMFLERGFEPDKLTAIGYADTRPQFPSRTPAGSWDEESLAKNRRVVIRILEQKVDSIPYSEATKAETVNPLTPPAPAATSTH